MRQKPQVPSSFTVKKNAILASLSIPEATYTDLSPKGSVDAPIKPLLDRINALEGVVTTSSCAGRLSVYLEGNKQGKGHEGRGDPKNNEGFGKESEQAVVSGGKGMGGKWLFVSHEPVDIHKNSGAKESVTELLGLGSSGGHDEALTFNREVDEMRLVRFQFEPMVCIGSSTKTTFSSLLIQSTTMFHVLRRTVDPPYHDRFSILCPAHPRSSHQRRFSRKRCSEPQELGRW